MSLRLQFLDFVLDAEARSLARGGRHVHLTPKALDLLVLLALERPRVVAKAEILDRVWPDTFVTDASVARTVHEIREALGGDADAAIRTAHGRGYAFVAVALRLDGDASPSAIPNGTPAAPTRGWLIHGSRARRLTDGALEIGRDPALAVAVECTHASWRHARLRVAAGGVTVEDLGSKNGTRVRGRPIEAPTALRDGDAIDIGSARFVYRSGAAHPATSTKG